MLSPGDRVKDYEVIAPLRAGGMAMLYLARRRGVGGFSRLVALKLIHPHLLGDHAVRELFLHEARLTANIAHPNVVNVEEVGQTHGSYFIAMEYVHGASLAELLSSVAARRLRMSPKLCVWLAAQVAEALHAVHEARGENGAPLNIVHRDVSPQNVLIGHTGHVKLIDLGIAKSQPTDGSVGARQTVLGKLGYMAPEQLRLEPADRRSDVYALGVMLWEMLTSRSLFRCRSIDDERDWTTRESPIPPSRYCASLPALDQVVLKAIAFDAADRYESAVELRTALLRAAPCATRVDAPMVGALMHTMLGHELERRRASLPSEVSVQLELEEDLTTSRPICVDELTADMLPSEPAHPCDTCAAEPTIAHSPTALRRDPSRKLPCIPPPADDILPQEAAHAPPPSLLPFEPSMIVTGTSEAEILTEPGVPFPVLAVQKREIARPRPRWLFSAGVLATMCLAVGMVLGATVSTGMPTKLPMSPARAQGADAPWLLQDGPRTNLTTRTDSTAFRASQVGSDAGRVALTYGIDKDERGDTRAAGRPRRSRREASASKRLSVGAHSSRTKTARTSRSSHRSR